jgi:hypothetical protein
MVANFIIALLMFFNISFGQVNTEKPTKTPPKQEMPEKTISINDINP